MDQFGRTQANMMHTAMTGGNPVSAGAYGIAGMPGMDPAGAAMFAGFGAATDAMFAAAQYQAQHHPGQYPPQQQGYPPQYPPQQQQQQQGYPAQYSPQQQHQPAGYPPQFPPQQQGYPAQHQHQPPQHFSPPQVNVHISPIPAPSHDHHHHHGHKHEMDGSSFAQLKAQVQKESFSSGKIGVIKVAAGNSHFSPQQIVELLGLLSFSNDKIEAAEALIPRLSTKDNSHIIISAATFDSDKKKLQEILSRC